MRYYKQEIRIPKIEVRKYQDVDGTVPLLDWLDDLPDKAKDKCVAVISRPADF
jgi:hypothetical protein